MVANSATAGSTHAETRETTHAPDDPIILTRAEYERQSTLHWQLGHAAGFRAGIAWADRAFNNAVAETLAHLPASAYDVVTWLVGRMNRGVAK